MKDFKNFTFSDFTEHSVAPQYEHPRRCRSGYARVLSKKFNTPHAAMVVVDGQLTQA